MIAMALAVPGALKRANFSRPYFSHDAIVTRKEAGRGSDRLKGGRSLCRRNIQDEYPHPWAEGILRFNVGKPQRSWRGADASFMDGVSVERYLSDDPVLGEGLMVAFSGRITAEAMGFAVSKIDGELLEGVNDALEALSAEGYLHDLGKKWFGRS